MGTASSTEGRGALDGRTTDPPPPPKPEATWPREFGRYVLLAPLAQGGMGDVCLALSGTLSDARRLCVLKTVRTEYAGERDFVQRFLDEGRMLCALTHPNIAQIVEVGIEGTTPFVAMEFIAGVDLDALVYSIRSTGRRLPLEFVLAVLAGMLDGMAFAHRARALDGTPLNLVHRDLSPQNVRVSWDGDVKVLDFGTAHAAGRSTQTAHGLVFGKPGYMSPEQARGERVDARSDLYAIGIVGWELAADRDFATLDGANHMEALAAGKLALDALTTTRADVPRELDVWFARMTEVRPDDRFPDAGAARRALADIAHVNGLRMDRDAVADVLERLFPGEQEADDARVRRLAGTARDVRPSPVPAPPTARQAHTEPLATSDANVIRGTRYRIGARLGAGAMGEVFAAEHMDLGRTVALKVLFADRSNDPGVVQRFRLEARAIASLSHPNLVHVYDLGNTEDGRLFYAMERLVGDSLRERLQQRKRLPAEECARIGAAVARGLAAAHAVGVVHRDIKPENVFLTRDGVVKVLDFGVAKTTNAEILGGQDATATRAGEIFGSPAYMAPEQARGTPVDARTDVYALGAVLYECATGHGMFDGATMVELLARQLMDTPVHPRLRAPDAQIPADLDAVVMRCLAKDPDARFQSATALAEALERMVAPDSATRVSAESVVLVRPGGTRTWRAALGVGAVTAVVLCVGAAWYAIAGEPVVPAPPPGAQSHASPSARHPTAVSHPAVSLPAPAVAPAPAVPVPAPVVSPPAPAPAVAPVPAPLVATVPVPAAGVAGTETTDHGEHRAAGLIRRAQEALRAHHLDEAERLATDAIHAHGGSEARNVLGLVYIQSGNRDRAIATWRTVLQADPHNAHARQYLHDVSASPEP